MPERKPLPPIRLNGALPDGVHNGLDHTLGAYFVDGGDPRLAVVRLGRKQLIHDDDSDAEVAVVRLLDIEVPDPGSVQAETLLATLIATRKLRTSAGTIPFPSRDEPAAGDLARRAAYEQAVTDYAAAKDLDARGAWVAHFGDDAPVGPRGAELAHLLEFAGDAGITIGEPDAAGPDDDELAASPGEPDDGDDGDPEAEGDARHAVAMAPAAPKPEWSDAQ